MEVPSRREKADFSICLESFVAFYTNPKVVRIKKPFTGFRGIRKKLIFEFKYDFQIFPNQDTGSRKLGLEYVSQRNDSYGSNPGGYSESLGGW